MPSPQVFSRCKRCNRALKNPKAQSIGYGATCLKKHKAEAEQALKYGMAKGEQGQDSLTSFIF